MQPSRARARVGFSVKGERRGVYIYDTMAVRVMLKIKNQTYSGVRARANKSVIEESSFE